MEKYRNFEIKNFSFSDLESHHVVSSTEAKPYDFKSLTHQTGNISTRQQDQIRTERTFASQNNFKIDDVVRDHRGFSGQEKNDFEDRVQKEVKRRLEKSFEEAYQEGLQKGRVDAKNKSEDDLKNAISEKIEEFEKIISEVNGQINHLFNQNKAEVLEFIKRFTKWIVLKEIDQKVYLESLFEKLILEMNARKNLIVKVGKKNFNQMPEVIKEVEQRLGQLSNVRVEIVPEIQYPGIILETENGLIDGSLESVFVNIDKIFEQVNSNG
jgi:flagellar assembly protein FliH